MFLYSDIYVLFCGDPKQPEKRFSIFLVLGVQINSVRFFVIKNAFISNQNVRSD